MCVQGGIGAVVVNGDVVAPGIAPIIGAVCGHDPTGAGCHDRRAAACGDIHAVVAVAECTADAGPARNRPCKAFTGIVIVIRRLRHRGRGGGRLYGRHRGRCRGRHNVAVIVHFFFRHRGRRRCGLYGRYRGRGGRGFCLCHLLLHFGDLCRHHVCEHVFFFLGTGKLGLGTALIGADLLEQGGVVAFELL